MSEIVLLDFLSPICPYKIVMPRRGGERILAFAEVTLLSTFPVHLFSTESSFKKQAIQTLLDFIILTCLFQSVLIIRGWIYFLDSHPQFFSSHMQWSPLVPGSIDSILLETLFSQELYNNVLSWFSSFFKMCFLCLLNSSASCPTRYYWALLSLPYLSNHYFHAIFS